MAALSTAAAERPDFLIVMVDDLGYGDIHCHGGRTPTPHIDRLFEQGVELGNFLTWSVCSPTRAGLLTAKHPLRLNQGPNTEGELAADTFTFGDAFQGQGYRTGMFGKWHNGRAPKFNEGAPHINDFGFDRWVGFYGGAIDFFTKVWPNTNTSPSWYHDRKEVNDEREYATDLLTKHATRFMTESRNEGKNFVCYVPYNTVHTPLHVRPEDLKRVPAPTIQAAGGLRPWEEYYRLTNAKDFGGKLHEAYVNLTGDRSLDRIQGTLSPEDGQVLYAAMLINLDDNIGRLMQYLDDQGLTENTVVWFFSDNGGTPQGRNVPYKGGKHSIWEGGIHSPAVVRWPAGTLTGPRRYDGLLGYLDVYPTCMQMAGFPLPHAAELDGKPCYQAIRTDSASPRTAYHYLYRDQDMIRTPRWKLFRGTQGFELYDLMTDIGEEHNVAQDHPDVAGQLRQQLDEWITKHRIAPSHLPNKSGDSAPSGDLLEVSFEVTKPILNNPARILLTPPAGRAGAGDRLEFDIRLASDSAAGGFHLAPLFRTTSLFFTGKPVDDRGQRINRGYAPASKPAQWERRTVGLATFAPRPLAPICVQVTARQSGRYRFYLDNIVVRRPDGVHVCWEGGSPILRAPPPELKNLEIRTVSVDQVR